MSASDDQVIETVALSKRYGRKLALDQLDLRIPRGRIHARGFLRARHPLGRRYPVQGAGTGQRPRAAASAVHRPGPPLGASDRRDDDTGSA